MSVPVVGGSRPVNVGGPVVNDPIVVGGLTGVKTVSPTQLSSVSIYNSFDADIAQNSPTNLAPVIVLGLNQSVPAGTKPGTLILRILAQ